MIDSHQHFWKIGQHDCTWPTNNLPAIYRDFLPEHLIPMAVSAGVTGSVVVQSQESNADTDFLLELATESNFIQAVVGWVDLLSPDAVNRVRTLAQHSKMRGLRPMLQDKADSWILDPNLKPVVTEMQKCGLSFDALVRVRHLSSLTIFAQQHPGLSIVIDHAAKPNIAGGEFDAWFTAIKPLARLPQVYCKLSGLLTEAGSLQGLDQIKPYTEQLFNLFGAERLMWGSDWPVLNLAPNGSFARYDLWLTSAKSLLPDASTEQLDAIFGQTAERFYKI